MDRELEGGLWRGSDLVAPISGSGRMEGSPRPLHGDTC